MKMKPVTRLFLRGAVTMMAVLGMSLAVLPTSPAAAARCNGGGYLLTSISGLVYSVEMKQNKGCTQAWAKLTIDLGYCCWRLHARVQREVWTPYGYYNTHTAAIWKPQGEQGNWNTGRVPNTNDDRHRICVGGSPYTSNTIDWECSSWT